MPSTNTTIKTSIQKKRPERPPRQRVEELVYADFGPDNGGFPINVSTGGLAFQGIRLLEKGQVLPVKFKLPGSDHAVSATGQVAWLNLTQKGGGLQFIDLPDENRNLITGWLSPVAQPAQLLVSSTTMEIQPEALNTAGPMQASTPQVVLETAAAEIQTAPTEQVWSPAPAEFAVAAQPKLEPEIACATIGETVVGFDELVTAAASESPAVDLAPGPVETAAPASEQTESDKLQPVPLVDTQITVENPAALLAPAPAELLPASEPSQLSADTAVVSGPVKLASVPAIEPPVTQGNSADKIDSKTVTSPEAPTVGVETATTVKVVAPTFFGPVEKPQTSAVLTSPKVTKKKHEWIAPYAWGAVTSVALVGIVSFAAWQFRADLLPYLGINVPAQDVAKSEPTRISEPLSKHPAVENRRKVTANTAVDAESESDNDATPTASAIPKGLDAHPVSAVARQKPNPSRKALRRMTANSKGKSTRPSASSEASDFLPPTFTLPMRQEFVPQLAVAAPMAPQPLQAKISATPQSARIDAAQLIGRRDPVYPFAARTSGVSGSVELHFTISAAGTVRDVTVVKGNRLLADAAVDAVRSWRYQPARRNGVPFDVGSNTTFVFKLQ